jgi:hypothetical protein
MTAQQELDLLETAYTSLLTGGVQSYTINGRSLTRLDFRYITERMDTLRAVVYRQTNGMMQAARNRKAE